MSPMKTRGAGVGGKWRGGLLHRESLSQSPISKKKPEFSTHKCTEDLQGGMLRAKGTVGTSSLVVALQSERLPVAP